MSHPEKGEISFFFKSEHLQWYCRTSLSQCSPDQKKVSLKGECRNNRSLRNMFIKSFIFYEFKTILNFNLLRKKQFYNQNKHKNKIERNKNQISDEFLFYCDMKY